MNILEFQGLTFLLKIINQRPQCFVNFTPYKKLIYKGQKLPFLTKIKIGEGIALGVVVDLKIQLTETSQ